MIKVHINCDMAESYGNLKVGNDKAILPLVDAVNIACGFHGGDPLTIEATIYAAIGLGIEVGAHPSYPDLSGFGRRHMEMSAQDLSACLRYQICAIKSITESLGGKLNHVKAHGALYNTGVKNKREAEIIVNTVYSIDSHLKIFAPYGSEMAKAASSKGMAVMFESFADRSYDSDGFLVSRSIDGSVISDPKNVWTQVSNILNGHLKSMDGNMIPIHSDTICVHGDHATVVESLILIRKTFGQKTNA